MLRTAKFYIFIIISIFLVNTPVFAVCNPAECGAFPAFVDCQDGFSCRDQCCVADTIGGGGGGTCGGSNGSCSGSCTSGTCRVPFNTQNGTSCGCLGGGGGSSCTVNTPQNLSVVCNVNGTATFSWGISNNGDCVNTYKLMVDNKKNRWVSCTNLNSGDLCKKSTGNVNTYTFAEKLAYDQNYSFGVQATGGGSDSIQVWSPDFTCNTPPTFSSLILKDDLNTTVLPDAGGRNNICQTNFVNSKIVNVEIGASDPNGVADITNIQLRWNGIVFTRTNFANGVANFTHTFNAGENNANVFDFQVNITDSTGLTTGWITTNRFFKVWNCIVPVSGSIFNGTDGQICSNGTGFSVLADSEMNFSSLIYKSILNSNDVVATVSPPASFGSNNLIWGDSYLPLINGGFSPNFENGDLVGSARVTRLIDTGVGTTICSGSAAVNTSTSVSAYSLSPGLIIDLSYIKNQGAWYQASGMDIRAKKKISAGIPLIANSFLTINNTAIGESNNGIVMAPQYENSSGWNDSSEYGSPPNNWYVNKPYVDPNKYDYNFLYRKYYEGYDQGTTGVTVINNGDTGIKFVKGDLTISSDIVVPENQFLMVIVKGTINIDIGASRVDGIYVADKAINVTGSSSNQLIINGVLYTPGLNSDIKLTRSFTDNSKNNTTPATLINYRPDMIFAIPGKLFRVLTGFREL